MVEAERPPFATIDQEVSIRRADYWLVEDVGSSPGAWAIITVSIRRADYWLVEGRNAGHVIHDRLTVSIRRADYWLVEAHGWCAFDHLLAVSIRRADYWLVEARSAGMPAPCRSGFNPPGGLLVG